MFKCLGSTNCGVIVSDVIVTEPDSDVTIRDIEVNKRVARKRYAQQHSLMHTKGFLISSLNMYSQTFTKDCFNISISNKHIGRCIDCKTA